MRKVLEYYKQSAYLSMTRSLSTPIAAGRTAEIYAWDDQHVLKLYQDWCPRDWADYEARIAGAVHEAGIPSPAVGELVDVNGRRGLIYERIEGISMLRSMNARPWMMLKHARWLADLQVHIHRQSIMGLPSYKDRLGHDIRRAKYLSQELQEKAIALLDGLPNGEQLCHGDYHPDNVLITKNGPMVIDWMTACSGSPWIDVARSSMILSIGAKAARNQVHPVVLLAIRLFHKRYLDRYRSHGIDQEDELNRWKPVIAAARLNEEIAPEREALLNIVKEG